ECGGSCVARSVRRACSCAARPRTCGCSTARWAASCWVTRPGRARAPAACCEHGMREAPPRPPLSVVIGTTEGWPHVRALLDSLRKDAEDVGVEIIVADGSTRPAPSAEETGPQVRWLSSSSNSVFRLFAEGLRVARGDVIATTEDHALPRPRWIAAIVRAHREH